MRRTTGVPLTEAPEQLTVHVGTAAVPARLRPFDDDHARLTLDRRLPLVLGDRLVLRHPGSRRVLGGAQVLDADPPPLRRRGDSARRTRCWPRWAPSGDVQVEVARRGAVEERHLRRLGLLPNEGPETPAGVRVLDGWWVHAPTYDAWQHRLRTALHELHERDPLAPGLSRGAASDLLALPDERCSTPSFATRASSRVVATSDCRAVATTSAPPKRRWPNLWAACGAEPFHAPEADDLAALHLGVRELAAAERAGRVLRLRDGVVLLPTAPALAMRELARLEQPFTTSQARQALGTTRRVAIPLLEHLDARGWTRRLDAGHREVVH